MQKKNYKSSSLNLTDNPVAEQVLRISVPRNPSSWRELDFTRYLGFGFDAWATQSAFVLNALLSAKKRSVCSIVNYAVYGLRAFFEFLACGIIKSPPKAPCFLTKQHLEAFISWLNVKYPNGTSAKGFYSTFKSLVFALSDYGFISADIDDLIPVRSFPDNYRRAKGAQPLSMSEMQRLMAALKLDLISIHKASFAGNGAEAMTVMFLVIAARSGINTTPLLEAARDSLKPHPFIPNLRLISTFKRRGKGAQLKAIRQNNLMDSHSSIPLDGVAVLKKAIEMSDPLVALASEELRGYIWLYRSGQPGAKDHIALLTMGAVSYSAKRICDRHSLVDDDGKPLRVSVSRLRKTMASRLWQLSRGDIVEVSSVMGHSPVVADNHYLNITDDLKLEGAKFIGQVFANHLRCTDVTPTPSGNCQDTLYGAKAPKDGLNHCGEFNHCLSCPSYAIVGTEDDLYRLFSYQKFLLAESEYYLTDEWRGWQARDFGYVRLIDEFTSHNFKADIVIRAKARAESSPHEFWAAKIRYLKKKFSGQL